MAQHIFFSTQTQLAYRITKKYFRGNFYVHCTEEFNPYTNPGSSNPAMLYTHYRRVVELQDRGDTKVQSLKQTLLRVARDKKIAHELTTEEYRAVRWEIDHAETREFAPVLYLIVKQLVPSSKITRLDPQYTASSRSVEYTISNLVEDEFDIIETELRLSGSIM